MIKKKRVIDCMSDTDKNAVRYFVGSNSSCGFFSLFSDVYDNRDGWRAFLIKGGPGSGKSTLMKKVAARFEERFPVEYLHCSSDPDSLDGVVLPDLKICVMDATAPHVLEPKYPGACENIINIGECWDPEILRRCSGEIIALAEECSALHRAAQSYLKGCGIIKRDGDRYYAEAVNTEKLARFAQRLSRRELPKISDSPGRQKRRMLSAYGPQGLKYFSETVNVLSDRVYCIQDDSGVISGQLLGEIRRCAIAAGYDVVSCMSPLFGEVTEHLLIPSAGLSLVTVNKFLKAPREGCRCINTRRFLDAQKLYGHKVRIGFNKKALTALTNEAGGQMLLAKQTHDLLERYYVSAMDFEKVERLGNGLCSMIEQIIA
ncbi:MAG: hypothetical protein IKS19_08245 [Clostridia bacterium]|nr:hypothetical protein [Clostridia bacterium]